MFAIARTAGWVSHWLEQQEDPENRIGRPRQIYTGAAQRDYTPMAGRFARASDPPRRPARGVVVHGLRIRGSARACFVAGDLVVRQQFAQLRGGRAAHRLRRPATAAPGGPPPGQHGEVEAEPSALNTHRRVQRAFPVEPQVAGPRLRGDAVLLEPARHGVRIVAVQVQGDRGVRIRGAVQHQPEPGLGR